MGQLSQQEYMDSINKINQELVQAWHQDFRVKALKITIQCSKYLVDTSVIQFYPSKFVLITDILDMFGKLVYDRLLSKAEYYPALPDNFTANMVPESAKETCRNWFYKIASIRELVPRLYVEAAILKSYSFLTNREFSQALMRLTRMTRGIGDPLVAIYARCYLCRVGMSVSTIDRQFLKDNFYDFLAVYDQLYSSHIKRELNAQKVDITTYLGLYAPALDWILQGLAHRAQHSLLDEIVDKCSGKKNKGLLLNSILSTFKPSYISSRAQYFIKLIESCSGDGLPQYIILKTLGECLQQYGVEDPLKILNLSWALINRLTNPSHFMTCAHAWANFVIKNLSPNEINIFLGDIISHVGFEGKNFYPILQDIITILFSNITDFESLFTMDKLLPLLDLFTEDVKANVCRKILDTFTTKHHCDKFTDPVMIDALIFIAKILHDSVTALTVDDEKRQIGNLISYLIRKIHFGRDFEKQLTFYVEARGTFTNIDSIHVTLVQCVNRLAVETGRIVKSHHTRKTSSFVRACAAYCYITIPALSSAIVKLQLYLLSAQVALFNQCLGQADACIKAALGLIPEIPSAIEVDSKLVSTQDFLRGYICNMLSTLIVVPDCPDQGVLYLTRGLVNVLQHYTEDNNSTIKSELYLNVIDMLATVSLSEYPYHIKKVDSNDVLYGSDPKFITEINKMCSILVEEVLNNLKSLRNNEELKKQSKLAFELFLRLVIHADLENPGMANLSFNLWNLALKHNSLDKTLIVSTNAFICYKFYCYIVIYCEKNVAIYVPLLLSTYCNGI
ncbi:hypothetical protein AAG570_000149 [Ranatra chinensis]|uniref:VPS35 endosomal protein sorting factor-like n=1 Tax=Ranatra chinensis TaxID=642074 RepID=A0ABD0Z6P5_9HEMI